MFGSCDYGNRCGYGLQAIGTRKEVTKRDAQTSTASQRRAGAASGKAAATVGRALAGPITPARAGSVLKLALVMVVMVFLLIREEEVGSDEDDNENENSDKVWRFVHHVGCGVTYIYPKIKATLLFSVKNVVDVPDGESVGCGRWRGRGRRLACRRGRGRGRGLVFAQRSSKEIGHRHLG